MRQRPAIKLKINPEEITSEELDEAGVNRKIPFDLPRKMEK